MDRYRGVTRAIELGSATGIHTWTGPAAVSWATAAGEMSLDASPLFILSDPDITFVLLLLAAGEIVADKLPYLPNRTAALPLLARMGCGGLAGAAAFVADGESGSLGAATGALAAAVSAAVTFRLRRFLTHSVGLPNSLAGLVDDALALLFARLALASGG